MMEPIFEITLKAQDENSPIRSIVVRTKGLSRQQAIEYAAEKFGAEFKLHYVIAGPRIDD